MCLCILCGVPEYTMLHLVCSVYFRFREKKREVSNVLSSLWFHLHNGVLFVHMQICLIITLDTPFPQRSGLVPSDRPQPTGDVTDPCSSPSMLVQNSRDVHLMYIAATAAIVCILHTFEIPIKYQDYFCNIIIRLNESEEKKSPISKKSLGVDPLMRTSCKHHCLGTRVDHYFGMLGLSTPPPPSKACGQLILNIPCNSLSASNAGLVSYLPKLGSSNESKIMTQSLEYLPICKYRDRYLFYSSVSR